MSPPAAAFFDVDGTVVDATIVHYFAVLRTREMPALAGWAWKLAFLPRIPYYWALDQVSRELFNERFYYNYRGFPADTFAERAETLFVEFIEPRIGPGATARIEQHRARGDAVVLLSGSLRPLLQPLARRLQADDVIAPRPEVKGGRLTGRLIEGALTGPRKAAAAAQWVERHGVELKNCHGYADSADDMPLLECLGRATAVNPDRSLRRTARQRGWEVVSWRRSSI